MIAGDNNFVIQPGPMHWKNLGNELDRSCVVADKNRREIWICWYAHTKTKKLSGVYVSPSIKQDWEKYVLWSIAEFGFRHAPIYRIDILSYDETETIKLGPLLCYTKTGSTTLTIHNKPTKVYTDLQNDLQLFLPETTTVQWSMRTKKGSAIGRDKQKCALTVIDTDRYISTMSTSFREIRLLYLLDRVEREKILNEMRTEHNKLAVIREQEIEYIKRLNTRHTELQEIYTYRNNRYRNIGTITNVLPASSEIDMISREYVKTKYGKNYKIIDNNTGMAYWSTMQLSVYIQKFDDLFVNNILDPRYTLKFNTSYKHTYKSKGKTRHYLEISCFEYPKEKEIEIKEIEKATELNTYIEEQTIKMERVESNKETFGNSITTMEPGQYLTYKYSRRLYRNTIRTTLFLLRANTDWEVEDETEQKVFGVFLEQEIEKIDIQNTLAPIRCTIGNTRTTPSKKKDKLVYLSTLEIKDIDTDTDADKCRHEVQRFIDICDIHKNLSKEEVIKNNDSDNKKLDEGETVKEILSTREREKRHDLYILNKNKTTEEKKEIKEKFMAARALKQKVIKKQTDVREILGLIRDVTNDSRVYTGQIEKYERELDNGDTVEQISNNAIKRFTQNKISKEHIFKRESAIKIFDTIQDITNKTNSINDIEKRKQIDIYI
jgi:hypothetical protein